ADFERRRAACGRQATAIATCAVETAARVAPEARRRPSCRASPARCGKPVRHCPPANLLGAGFTSATTAGVSATVEVGANGAAFWSLDARTWTPTDQAGVSSGR